MSAARIEKLKGLLTRVQERRAQPRLSAVGPATAPRPSLAQALTVEPSDTETSPPQVTARDGVALLEPLSAPVPQREPPQVVARGPAFEPPASSPAAPTSEPSELRTEPPPAGGSPTLAPPADSLPPPAEPAASEEPRIAAPTARIEAPPFSASKPVARAVSSPVVEAPKTFGDLLEASLALRPR